LDLQRIEARLARGSAKLAELRGKAVEVPAEMKLEYLSQVRNLEKIKNAFEKKHKHLRIATERVF
jgi:hypothetical protein